MLKIKYFKNNRNKNLFLNCFSSRIHPSHKEYGFGQSLLHEGQLVFHTPPYSLHPVALHEGNESIGKANIRIIRPPCNTDSHTDFRRSPMPHHRIIGDASPQPILPLNKTASGDKIDRHSYAGKLKPKDNNGVVAPATSGSCSPGTLERKTRRFSYANSRQNINSHEVPYARLLDSPSRITKTKDTVDSRISPTPSVRHAIGVHEGLMTPKALRIPIQKTSSSDSKLTGEYFQQEVDLSVSFFKGFEIKVNVNVC